MKIIILIIASLIGLILLIASELTYLKIKRTFKTFKNER